MSEPDEVLALVDDLLRLAEGSAATRIEVETEEFAVSVSRDAAPVIAAHPRVPAARAPVDRDGRVRRVTANAVGIFSASREWRAGEAVTRGAVLGAIQSLGHMAEITAPADGSIREVLVAAGAPVEYGQALFAIEPGSPTTG